MDGEEDRRLSAIVRVIGLLTETLDLVDAHGLNPQAGAYVEMALQCLRVTLGEGA